MAETLSLSWKDFEKNGNEHQCIARKLTLSAPDLIGVPSVFVLRTQPSIEFRDPIATANTYRQILMARDSDTGNGEKYGVPFRALYSVVSFPHSTP